MAGTGLAMARRGLIPFKTFPVAFSHGGGFLPPDSPGPRGLGFAICEAKTIKVLILHQGIDTGGEGDLVKHVRLREKLTAGGVTLSG